MGSYRLSAQAEADLVSIYDHSEREFGEYQAEAYLSGLERIFGLLADFPGIGQAVDELATGHRRFRFQAHHVFYTTDADGVVIRAIFHAARDIRPGLFS
jgi:toxin ParE1/3/4